jgi:hypothetical protein
MYTHSLTDSLTDHCISKTTGRRNLKFGTNEVHNKCRCAKKAFLKIQILTNFNLNKQNLIFAKFLTTSFEIWVSSSKYKYTGDLQKILLLPIFFYKTVFY